MESISRFRDGRRHLPRFDLRLKTDFFVRAVAKGLVFTVAAAAESNLGPAGQVKLVSLFVEQLKISLHPDTPVRSHRDLGRHYFPF